MIDKYPALICRCAHRADVMRAVDFAHSQHLPVAVRVAATASLARPFVMGVSSSTFLR